MALAARRSGGRVVSTRRAADRRRVGAVAGPRRRRRRGSGRRHTGGGRIARRPTRPLRSLPRPAEHHRGGTRHEQHGSRHRPDQRLPPRPAGTAGTPRRTATGDVEVVIVIIVVRDGSSSTRGSRTLPDIPVNLRGHLIERPRRLRLERVVPIRIEHLRMVRINTHRLGNPRPEPVIRRTGLHRRLRLLNIRPRHTRQTHSEGGQRARNRRTRLGGDDPVVFEVRGAGGFGLRFRLRIRF